MTQLYESQQCLAADRSPQQQQTKLKKTLASVETIAAVKKWSSLQTLNLAAVGTMSNGLSIESKINEETLMATSGELECSNEDPSLAVKKLKQKFDSQVSLLEISFNGF